MGFYQSIYNIRLPQISAVCETGRQKMGTPPPQRKTIVICLLVSRFSHPRYQLLKFPTSPGPARKKSLACCTSATTRSRSDFKLRSTSANLPLAACKSEKKAHRVGAQSRCTESVCPQSLFCLLVAGNRFCWTSLELSRRSKEESRSPKTVRHNPHQT